MIRHELMPDDGILVLQPEGPLSRRDFEEVAASLDDYLEEAGRLRGVMIRAVSFPGWEDFSALVSHLRFVKDHHRRIDRVAMVSDSNVLTIAPHIADHFVSAEVREFGLAEEEAAMEWLRS
jgi:hypothetical protein